MAISNQRPIQDQPYYNAAYRVNVTTQTQLTSNSTFRALAMEEYLTNQTGPYADAGGNVVGSLPSLPSLYNLDTHCAVVQDGKSFQNRFEVNLARARPLNSPNSPKTGLS